MINWWILLLLSIGYVMLLFGIAYWGDRPGSRSFSPLSRSVIYSLTLAVYCTSWTFFGAVGSAANAGWLYLPIYLGPVLVVLFGWRIISRIIAVSKRQNLTSIADFIAARYGKARSLAVLVTVIATIGSVPYIALQLKAIVSGFNIVSDYSMSMGSGLDTALIVSAAMAGFAILFGTRQVDVTEHHKGMMLAIAFESVVKLAAFVAVGLFALALLNSNEAPAVAASPFTFDSLPDTFITQLLLASAAIICLPRQFHVAVVEARSEADTYAARWALPLYLVIFSIFVIPITLAGLSLLPSGTYTGDMFVLGLPMSANQDWLTMLAFLGGFSAATGMVIVASVALSTMICNEIVMPLLFRLRLFGLPDRDDYSRLLIHVRRAAIVGIAALAYVYYVATDESAALAAFGLLSFAAAAQFAPLLLFGLYWSRSTRVGAISGLSAGFALWCYTLFLPALARAGAFDDGFLNDGLFGLAWLRPESLFFDSGISALTHGVAWSLGINIVTVVIVSLLTTQSVVEKIQARAFSNAPARRTTTRRATSESHITNADLLALAERFVGERHAKRAFEDFSLSEDSPFDATGPADPGRLRFTERLLAGAIGASSARVVVTAALQKTGMQIGDVVTLLDETSEAIRFNRRLLESTLENITQGVSVVDASQRLIGWNSRYAEMLDYPPSMLHIGRPIAELIRLNAERGRFGDTDIDTEVEKRLGYLRAGSAYRYESQFDDGRVIEIRGEPMPQGGYVTTYTDISEFKAVEAALVEAKAMLEQRVADRTAELEETMLALRDAKAEAEDANTSKTRFLAAAAHDLLQPLNAAKLFNAVLGENQEGMTDEQRTLVARVESGLVAVEDLLGALLDISRLDTAAPVPKHEAFPVAELFEALQTQFAPGFAEKNLELRLAHTKLWIYSDRALLRRILQNFLSNARRYTEKGRVLVGCRRRGNSVVIQVYDTGIGISEDDQRIVFEEFRRLTGSDKTARRGLGLGLAIVDRIAKLLGHPINMRSTPLKGSCFEVSVPLAKPRRVSAKSGGEQRRIVASPLTNQVILCIDNEPEILDAMRHLLDKWGARPVTAGSIAAAIEAADTVQRDTGAPPALMLVDYHLDDGATGLEAVAAVGEHTGRDIPAVILTADHTDAVIGAVRESGFRLLHKPVKPAALRALMTSLLSRRDVA
ncbi:MAG: PAS-domain containing protein [Woeseiaceae bacterium]|nr:PAS-domain containing protein [Woeseiaceae bacterium]